MAVVSVLAAHCARLLAALHLRPAVAVVHARSKASAQYVRLARHVVKAVASRRAARRWQSAHVMSARSLASHVVSVPSQASAHRASQPMPTIAVAVRPAKVSVQALGVALANRSN